MQCFVFLGFLSLLKNFGLATPISVGIRVLGVKIPYELNCSREIGHKTKLIPFFSLISASLLLLLLPCNIWKYFFPRLFSSFTVDFFYTGNWIIWGSLL